MNELEGFESAFKCTSRAKKPTAHSAGIALSDGLELVLRKIGGMTFNDGLYRVLGLGDIERATKDLERAYPEYKGKITAFAFDWLGRFFVLDSRRVVHGQDQILLLEVGAGEAMQIDCDIVSFHNEELPAYADDALAKPFFSEWIGRGNAGPKFNECVGYDVPLFLGGKDVVENLSLCDLSVYLEICGQLRTKARVFEDGQSVGQIRFKS